MKLIVGLGNPEDKYSGSRHNLGFDVVNHFVMDNLSVKDSNEKFWRMEDKFKSEIGKLDTLDIIVAKPQTSMNLSGIAVQKIASFYKIDPQDIVIVHDELDLPLGQIKIRLGGAAAGHHGVESVMAKLGTDKFIRVRCGIGNLKTKGGERKGAEYNTERFVLEPFSKEEASPVKHLLKKAMKALDILLKDGLDKAQNQFN